MSSAKIPAYYSLSGHLQLCIISDGVLNLGSPQKVFAGDAVHDIEHSLTRNFLPSTEILVDQNILFFMIEDLAVLVETGVGGFKGFGDDAGNLIKNLVAAGINPERIDAVLVSHPHPDHVGGLCDGDGRPTFPNASIYLSKKDFEYWTDEALLDSWADVAIRSARENLLPLKDRLVFIHDKEEFLPGITAHFTPGHTAEHICFEICSGGECLFLIGDLAHHAILSLENPSMSFSADLDPAAAAKTRNRVLSNLAAKRQRVLGYHFPWPGLGYIAEQGDGFRFVPEPIRW